MKTKPKKPSTKQKPMPILKDKEALKNTVADNKEFHNLFTKCLVAKKS
jgi:hypothetical protein